MTQQRKCTSYSHCNSKVLVTGACLGRRVAACISLYLAKEGDFREQALPVCLHQPVTAEYINKMAGLHGPAQEPTASAMPYMVEEMFSSVCDPDLQQELPRPAAPRASRAHARPQRSREQGPRLRQEPDSSVKKAACCSDAIALCPSLASQILHAQIVYSTF